MNYGNDLLLKNGDFLFGANGDLFTIDDYEKKNQDSAKFKGYFNILFSLTDRLLTIKGDNVFHSSYIS